MELYRERWFSNPRHIAQDALSGRTYYVDDDTLRYHKSRILAARVHYSGLLFSIIESVALDPQGSRRGYRYVVFDIFGSVVGTRVDLDHCWKRSDQASKALTAELLTLDAKALTLEAIEHQRKNHSRALDDISATVAKLARTVSP